MKEASHICGNNLMESIYREKEKKMITREIKRNVSFFSDSPILNLRLGSSLNPKAIKEGDDVYFECLIRANPSTHKLSWYHNVSLLRTKYCP